MKLSYDDHQILRLAVPSIVQNITVPLLGLADIAIIGHIGDARHIGAIAVGSMVFNVMYWLMGFLRMGTGGLTAQARGARRFDEATDVLRRGLVMAMTVALAIVVLQVPLRHLAFWLMQTTPDVTALATPYYNIGVWGAPAVMGLYVLNGWYIGMQNTRTPMVVAVGQNVLNIGLSALLVFGFHMGIEGAAMGTVVAQWAGFLLSLLLLRSYYGRHLNRRWGGSRWRDYRHFLSINRDIFLRTVCLVAVNLYFTSAGAAQGALILAVNTVLMQLFMLFSYVMDGFAYAGEALAGKHLGAANPALLRRTVSRLFRWGWAMVALFTAVYALGGRAFLSLLTTDATVVEACGDYFGWTLLIPLCGMAAFIWDGVFIGMTLTRGMLKSCFVATAAFFGLWAALHGTMGNHALWLAQLVYLALRGLLQMQIFNKTIATRPFFRQ